MGKPLTVADVAKAVSDSSPTKRAGTKPIVADTLNVLATRFLLPAVATLLVKLSLEQSEPDPNAQEPKVTARSSRASRSKDK